MGAQGGGGDLYVRRVSRENDNLDMHMMTIAEISIAAGHHPAVDASASARDVELAHEASFCTHNLSRYSHTREAADDDDAYVFRLHSAEDAERLFWTGRSVQELPKMALARWLEVDKGMDRSDSYNSLTKVALITAIFPDYVPPPPACSTTWRRWWWWSCSCKGWARPRSRRACCRWRSSSSSSSCASSPAAKSKRSRSRSRRSWSPCTWLRETRWRSRSTFGMPTSVTASASATLNNEFGVFRRTRQV